MRAMVLERLGENLKLTEVPKPIVKRGQLLIKVTACGICRTDLHVVDGDLKQPKLPLIPGHQIVGVVEQIGNGELATQPTLFTVGQRVGVPWLGGSCGHCEYCASDKENLCDQPVYTGYQVDGGFADYALADARYCFPIPEGFSDQQAAPLLCAGLIGYRAYRRLGPVKRIGFYGFGAAAHILVQVARYFHQHVYAFTRPGDEDAQMFARQLGVVWAGSSNELPPDPLDAAIIFAADGRCIPQALKAVKKGGKVICAGIHMSTIPSFSYDLLWGERSIESIANLSRDDGDAFLSLATKTPIQTEVHVYPLEQANQALDDLRQGRFTGAAVLVP